MNLVMTEEERKKSEDHLKTVAKYLVETAIVKLAKDLENKDGVPTDSFSLE